MKLNKNIFSIVTILLLLSFVVSMFASVGIANAQTEREITTFPFISTVPKNAGAGQTVLINFGLLNNLARQTDGWNVTAVITDPDGNVERIPGMTWSTGTVGKAYTPTKEGDYTLVCTFDRVYYESGTTSTRTGWYAASESEPFIMHVSSEVKPDYPGHNLPTEYWSRPIDSQLYEWYSIAGSWVTRTVTPLAEFNDAPMSAHVLWSMPVGDTMGGLAGGNSGYHYYQDGDAYEGKFVASAIIAGVLYYNKHAASGGAAAGNQAIVAVDLHTGEKLWERSYNLGNGRLATGQILDFITYNNRGVWAYLWIVGGTDMFALDAKTGDPIFNITDVPAGTLYYGPNGELLKYQLVNYGTNENPNWHLLQWNSTYVAVGLGADWGRAINNRTFNSTVRGYDINVSLGAGTVLTGSILTAFPCDRVVVANSSSAGIILSAISIKPGDEGRMLFTNVNWQAPAVWQDFLWTGYPSNWATVSREDLVAVFWTKEDRCHYGFSLETGAYMWVTESQVYQDSWVTATMNRSGSPNSAGQIIVYGKLYSANVGGVVYCYDVKTGQRLWTYEATDKYTESYIAEEWAVVSLFASCGKVYFGHMEHSTQEIKPRGAPFFALDAESGELVWSIEGAFRQTMWGGLAILGDSIIATMDTYDQQIYAIGKGPSTMTISVPDTASATNTLLIRGTIMDNSPGAQTDKMKLRFPNGVPTVSEASMSNWMLYVYKSFERPYDAVGVPITVCAVDQNGKETYINTVSDANGNFIAEFTPEIEGIYDVYAYFDGSASYYGSSAETLLSVKGTTETANNSAPPYEWYIIGMGIVIVVTVVLVGLWIKKK